MLKKSAILGSGLFVACVAAMPLAGTYGTARGASISDGNSTVTINPSSSSAPFVSQWVVDGVDQYGGSVGGGEGLSYSLTPGSGYNLINSLPVQSSFFGSGIGSVTYTGTGFTVTVKDVLSGGSTGSGASGINETITVDNTTSTETPSVAGNGVSVGVTPLQFSVQDIVNLNVNGTPNNDTLTLSPATGTNTADQTDPTGAHVNFSVTPAPDVVSSKNLLTMMTNPTLGPSTGDEAFDFTWNLSVDPGGSAIISLNQTLTGGTSGGTPAAVPLPSSAWSALTTLAGMGIFSMVRRMRKAAN